MAVTPYYILFDLPIVVEGGLLEVAVMFDAFDHGLALLVVHVVGLLQAWRRTESSPLASWLFVSSFLSYADFR